MPMNVRLAKPELQFLLEDCGASVLVFQNDVAGILPDAADLPQVLAPGASRAERVGPVAAAQHERGRRQDPGEEGEENGGRPQQRGVEAEEATRASLGRSQGKGGGNPREHRRPT